MYVCMYVYIHKYVPPHPLQGEPGMLGSGCKFFQALESTVGPNTGADLFQTYFAQDVAYTYTHV
jgi:hypothetical protein